MGGVEKGPWGERQREQKRDVFELTERHAAAYRNLHAWTADMEAARRDGFTLGIQAGAVILFVLEIITGIVLHYCGVIL